MTSRSFAQLAMYPMAHLSASYDILWGRLSRALIAEGLDDVPDALAWDREPHATWLDPEAFLTQTCGWPLITGLEGRVTLVGSFDVVAPFAAGGWYRSVVVSSKPLSVADWQAQGGCRLVANSTDSLSGWVSLLWAWGGQPANVEMTGAHVDSLEEVAAGRADLASIDAVTFAHVVAADPTLAARVHIVGHGPLVPSLPLVCAPRFTSNVAVVQRVVGEVLSASSRAADIELTAALATLKIRGFVPLGLEAFAHLARLSPPPAD